MKSAKNPFLYPALTALTAAVLVVFILSGYLRNRSSSAPFETMLDAVTAAADMDKMQQADHQMIKRLYKIDPADYEDAALYYPLTNMGAEELFLLKLRDLSQQKATQEAMEARLAVQKNSFEGYGIDQSAMLEKSIIEIRGNYALFISGDRPGDVLKAFSGAF